MLENTARSSPFEHWRQVIRRYWLQLGYGSLLLLAVWLSVAAILSHDHDQAVREIRQNNDQLARGFEEHVRRSLYAVEEQMLLIKGEYERAGVTPAIEGLFVRSQLNPLLVQILIIDSSGNLVVSVKPGTTGMNFADRSYFQAHIASDTQKTFISEPIVGRITNKSAILLSRRLNSPDGNFAGVVVMAVDSAYFTNFYQTMEFTPGQFVRIVGLDGVIRASWIGNDSENGRNMKRSDLFEKYLPEKPSGSYYATGRYFGIPRFVSYRSVPDYQLVIQVGFDAEPALAEYRGRIRVNLVAASIASLLIILFTGLAIFNARGQRRKDERWKLVVEGVNDGIWDWDASTNKVFYSDRCKEILGYAAEEISDSREEWVSRSHPEDLERVQKAIDDHRQGLTPLFSETNRLRCKDGAFKWVRSRGKVLRDDDGQVVRMIGALADIHAEKEAADALQISEQALRDSREKYKALIDQSFEAVALLYQEKREIIEVNQRFTEWFGYSLPEDAPLTTDKILTDAEDTQEKYYENLRNTGCVPVERRTYRHKNGSLVFMERSVTLVNHLGHQLVMITYRNIADQLQQEQKQRQDATVARRIQRAQIYCPPDSDYVALDTLFYACADISGDLYHLEWRNDGQLLRGYLVDVTGHGLTTALYTSTINVLLHEAAEMDASLPEQVGWLNRQVARHFETNSFAAAIAFEIDLQMRELRYVGAGITRFWAGMEAKNGLVKVPGLYLGIDAQLEYGMQSMPLCAGDRLCFSTDGLDRRLVGQVESLRADCRQISDMLESMPELPECRDDATAVCIRIKSLPQGMLSDSWPKELKMNGYDDYRRLKGEVAKVLAEETRQAHSLQEVAVNEAIANALECRDGQARNQKARIKFNRVGVWLIVRVKTSRIGFAGNAVLRRLRANPETIFSFGEDASMGRGIPMMFAMSHKMTYNSEGTEVLLAWKL